MRIWQRRAHPVLWLLVAAAVVAVLALLLQHEPGLLKVF